MSLASYSDLKDAIAGWLNRSDLDARIPDFITLNEADLQRRVIHEMGMSNRLTLTITSGAANLPDDFNGVIALRGPYKRLIFTPLDSFDDYDLTCVSDCPTNYTLSGGKVFFYPVPTDGATVTLTYKVKIDLLKYGPNWLLDNHPDAYLYGSLIHAEPYIVEDERVPMWVAAYEKILRDIELDGIRQSSGGSLQIKSNGPRW